MRPPFNVHLVEFGFMQLPLTGFHREAGKGPTPLIDMGINIDLKIKYALFFTYEICEYDGCPAFPH
jgi:hypothetical protein